ncbi:MAG: hypothetical protein V1908_01400 [Candidatus Peregrinibacteria bacterium]
MPEKLSKKNMAEAVERLTEEIGRRELKRVLMPVVECTFEIPRSEFSEGCLTTDGLEISHTMQALIAYARREIGATETIGKIRLPRQFRLSAS